MSDSAIQDRVLLANFARVAEEVCFSVRAGITSQQVADLGHNHPGDKPRWTGPQERACAELVVKVAAVGRCHERTGVDQDHRPKGKSARRISSERSARSGEPEKLAKRLGSLEYREASLRS